MQGGDGESEIVEWEGRVLAAARVLAGLTVRELAAEAATTPRVITQLERRALIRVSPRQRHGYTSADLWGRIFEALARHGVEVVPEAEQHGAGVRWVQSRGIASRK